MSKTLRHRFAGLLPVFALIVACSLVAAAQPPKTEKAADTKTPAKNEPDLTGFKTVDKAITTRISKAAPEQATQPGYLGIQVAPNPKGKLLVEYVEPSSPAAAAGLAEGDLLLKLGDQEISNADALRGQLLSRSPGEVVRLAIQRKDKPMELTAQLGGTSRPLNVDGRRVVLGIRFGEAKDDKGMPVDVVTEGSGAAVAGVKKGDILVKLDGVALTANDRMADKLAEKKPGDKVTMLIRRDGKEMELSATLGTDTLNGGARPAGWDERGRRYFTKNVYRLAIVGIEFPDVKHNDKIKNTDWQDSLFSKGTYTKTSVTGQNVFGSLNDYYIEQSYGALRVEGKMFDYVEASKKRAEYANDTGNRKTALLSEALDKLLARDGKDALKDYDGIFFIYAGERVSTNRGGLYWPHRANVTHSGKRLDYFIVQEGGARMTNISVICHEFGHLLGLPDLYARPENPGSEGLGVWCAMSNQIGTGRPQHFSAWPKEKLGWLKPAVIDPTVKQKLILAPVEDSAKECYKVLIRPDGSEYILLENRVNKGFDKELPAQGLLIWHVVQDKPILEESHGVEGPSGPRVFLNSVPYPSPSNNAYTPYTMPSSKPQMGAGLPVHITNIRKLPDGRITFYIGYEQL